MFEFNSASALKPDTPIRVLRLVCPRHAACAVPVRLDIAEERNIREQEKIMNRREKGRNGEKDSCCSFLPYLSSLVENKRLISTARSGCDRKMAQLWSIVYSCCLPRVSWRKVLSSSASGHPG